LNPLTALTKRTGIALLVLAVALIATAGAFITPAQVIITDPSGRGVAAYVETSNQTINRNGQIFTGAVRFQASTSGRYEIRVTGDSPSQVIITEDLGSAFAAVLGWFGALFGGMVLLTGGIVILVRGRRRAAHPA
jgi:hypothetical protein